jgi:hypothetical protein
MTPIVLPTWFFMGAASTERVRYPVMSSQWRDVARDAGADGQLDALGLVADDDAREQALSLLVEQVERGPVGLEKLRDLAENELEQLVEIERRSEREAHVAERAHRPLRPDELRVELRHLRLEFERPRDELVALGRSTGRRA